MSDTGGKSTFIHRNGSFYLPAEEQMPLYHTLENDLKKQGVTEGLISPDWWEFQKQEVKNGLKELIVASDPQVCSIQVKRWPLLKNYNDILQLVALHEKYRIFQEHRPFSGEDILPPTVFVRKNEEFLTIQDNGKGMPKDFQWDKTSVHMTDNKKVWLFKAMESGYLTLYNGILSVIPPAWIFKDNIRIYFRFLPVVHNNDEIIAFYFKQLNEHKTKYPKSRTDDTADKSLLSSFIPKDRVREIILCDGEEAIQGRDGQLNILVKEDIPEDNEEKNIDYHNWNRYKTVIQEQPVAELLPSIQGKEGFNIFGKTINVTKGKDLTVSAGQNIITEKQQGKIVYKASTSGLFLFNGKEVSVSEIFIIHGDVNYNTGNIDYDKTVHIKGNVTSGFSVKSRELLIIEGVVEDGCQIESQGNMEVQKGILGEKTKVNCYGNLMAGYIQDAVIYVRGDINVSKNIIRGHIFTEGSLNVLGNKVKGKNAGSVMGGSYYSMKDITVHSAGSANSKTLLSLGYNPYTLLSIDEIKSNISVIDRKLATSMASLPADIKTERGIKRLQLLTRKEKNKLKEELLTLKKLSLKKGELEKKVEVEKEKQFVSQPELLKLTVTSGIIGDLQIRIGTTRAVFENKKGKSELTLNPETNTIIIT